METHIPATMGDTTIIMGVDTIMADDMKAGRITTAAQTITAGTTTMADTTTAAAMNTTTARGSSRTEAFTIERAALQV